MSHAKIKYRDKPVTVATLGTVLVIMLVLGNYDTAAVIIGLGTIALVASAYRNPVTGLNHRTVFATGLAGFAAGLLTVCPVTMAIAAALILSGFLVKDRGSRQTSKYRRTGLAA